LGSSRTRGEIGKPKGQGYKPRNVMSHWVRLFRLKTRVPGRGEARLGLPGAGAPKISLDVDSEADNCIAQTCWLRIYN